MAGVPATVTLNAEYNRKAQAGALMIASNRQLNHTPPPSWMNYSAEGAEALSHSNICFSQQSDIGCVTGYVADPGSNNPAAGHRRWILYPQTRQTGVGDIPDGTSMHWSVLWAHDILNMFDSRPPTRDEFVAWPPRGFVPWQVVFPRWSFSLANASFLSANVSMTRNGSPVSVRLEPVENGYGENTIVWIPDGQDPNVFPATQPVGSDVQYVVNVSNVLIGGVPRNFTYNVTVFDPDVPLTTFQPAVESLEPFTGTASSQLFTAVFSDLEGWRDIARANVAFNVVAGTAGGCVVEVSPTTNEVRLYNDAGTTRLGPVLLGSNGLLENGTCSVSAGASSIQTSGNVLAVRLAVTFKPTVFGQKRTVYTSATDTGGLSSGWYALGAWYPNSAAQLVNRYRVYSPASSTHFHTTDLNEYLTLGSWGFQLEGVSGRVYNSPGTSQPVTPLYRIYNITDRRHFWTASRNEYTTLIRYRNNYDGEGIDGFVFSTPAAGTIPVYRLLYTLAGPLTHHWTPSDNEHTYLVGTGAWKSEGIAFYFYPPN